MGIWLAVVAQKALAASAVLLHGVRSARQMSWVHLGQLPTWVDPPCLIAMARDSVWAADLDGGIAELRDRYSWADWGSARRSCLPRRVRLSPLRSSQYNRTSLRLGRKVVSIIFRGPIYCSRPKLAGWYPKPTARRFTRLWMATRAGM